MKNTIKQNIKAIILGLIFTLGVGYGMANFTSPTFKPPLCPLETEACNAPINVGNSDQEKTGILTLLNLITPKLIVTNPDGSITGITDGKVLTAKGITGEAEWRTPSSGGSTYFLSTPITLPFPAASRGSWLTYNGSSIFPSNVSAVILESEVIVPQNTNFGQPLGVRKNSTSPTLMAVRTITGTADSPHANAMQGIFPVDTTSKTFEYQNINFTSSRIIGYLTN